MAQFVDKSSISLKYKFLRKISNNMNNEIGRKLTSLTLMTIMLAGGMTIAAPSMMPQAAAAGQLYVSAENAQFGNLFGGAQVIEVIVRDPNRADTEVAEAEPTSQSRQSIVDEWHKVLTVIGTHTSVVHTPILSAADTAC